jgi:lipid II:glycine glycyltransferase (peptidoglycan interpeptide bridge formation enzyme)
MTDAPTVRKATADDLATWDERTVQVPGGHVYQSRAWAACRAASGWKPWFLVVSQQPVLVLTRPFPFVGGRSAYIPRGPIGDPGEAAAAIAARTVAIADWLAARRVAVVATDAEIPAARTGVAAGLARSGFRRIPEIQPSRHRISLEIADGADDGSLLRGVTKSTRQRIRKAEASGIVVYRHDTAGLAAPDLFAAPDRQVEAVFGEFATLLEGTGDRRGFRFGPRDVFIDWWRAGHEAGHVIHLEARDGGETLGGLLLYRHGDRLSTVHSADAPGVRDRHPGVMHLLRWRAIQLALREGRHEMDLGGVDSGPDHREPGEGHPMAGLYEHKRSFGAHWVEMIGAHERVLDPVRYAAGRLAARAARVVRR